MTFTGFPDRLFSFYEGLEADNSKTYWKDNKDVYEDSVARPMRELLDELEPEFGEAKFFRPYRDVRFGKDKTPYKTEAAAAVSGDSGTLYLSVSADGLLLAGGYYMTSTEQARRLRGAIADAGSGEALVALVAVLRSARWSVDGDQLKRIPAPWDDGHPRADLLRHKTLTASRRYEPRAWMHTAVARRRIAEQWRQLAPLNTWLTDNVGSS